MALILKSIASLDEYSCLSIEKEFKDKSTVPSEHVII